MLARRAVLLAPLALAGCSWFDDWFGDKKKPLPGKRENVFADRRGLVVDEGAPKVMLPPAVRNAAWPQAGGNPAHLMGHLEANDHLAEAWKADIGDGGGYRKIIMAQPVVLNGTVFTMDSDAVVSAFSLADGKRLWRVDTKPKDLDSTNVGGGLGVDGSTLYADNGLSSLVALDVATGKEKWRANLGFPARSAPMIADGRVFVTTIDDRLLAFTAADGRQLWTHQAAEPVTSMLGQPAAGILARPGRGRDSAPANSPACAPTAAAWSGPTASARRRDVPRSRTCCRSAACRSSSTGWCMRSAWAVCWSATTSRPGGGCGSARSPARTHPISPATGCS